MSTRRGYRRQDNDFARTLALLDTIGVSKRGHNVDMYISREARAALLARAAKLRVCPSGLAAYIVECNLRETA